MSVKERKRIFARKPSGNSRVRQEFREDSDIVHILKKARKGQPVSWVNNRSARFLDLTDMPRDLHSVFEIAAAAQEAFMELPALMREELGNDPARVGEINEPMMRRHGLWRDTETHEEREEREKESSAERIDQVSRNLKKNSKAASPPKSEKAEDDDA